MKIFKKALTLLAVAILTMAFALSAGACKEETPKTEVPTTYTVTVDYQIDGTDKAVYSVKAGTPFAEPTSPVNPGYTFVNWYLDSEGEGEPYDFTSLIEADITIYAVWKSDSSSQPTPPPASDEVQITFHTEGGNQMSAVNIKKGTAYTAPTPTYDAQHVFEGWYTDSAKTQLFVNGTVINENKDLYAKWRTVSPTDEKVTVTFIYNDNKTANTTQQVIKGSPLNTLPSPTREDYNFDGWYKDSGLTQKFNVGDIVNADLNLYAKWTPKATSGGQQTIPEQSEAYTVTFVTNEADNEVTPQRVVKGKTVTKPVVYKTGFLLESWCTDEDLEIPYNFSSPVQNDFTLYAKWTPFESNGILSVGAYNESLYVTWEETNANNAHVYYQLNGESDWTEIDAPLVRMTESGVARADALGLKPGDYKIKVTTATNNDIEIPAPVTVNEYDRSGYAHFQYEDGVGAYNDDGTLKDGALVIYVTEENKNNVIGDAYLDGHKEDITSYMNATSAASGVTLGPQTGIGELLNNRRYAGADRMKVGIAALTQHYGAVAVRFIGQVSAENPSDCKVSTINGLTTYDSTENGGSTGDNGRMARMVNAKNLTIEGVGEDSGLYGWGIHFIASDVLQNYPGAGKGFEVRNLTFEHYPEDAVGMEGVQGEKWDETGSITGGASSAEAGLPSPVQRCWIHNNTFLPGYCPNPTDSDKSEGDGSCDFKRGRYYTLAYNYFTDCHKTNLIGSSDDSLQYDITMHHNWWNNCGSRMPLLRRANVHFYNNYFSGDMSRNPKPDLSHVTSARANSYMFSENNYFDGAKNVVLCVSGAVVKSYGDTFYATFDSYDGTIVNTRDQAVASSCRFTKENINYVNFDTNKDLFYYDEVNKCSDCLLDDAPTARIKAMMYAGANGHGVTNTQMNYNTPSAAVQVGPDGAQITMPTNTDRHENNGVLFIGVSKEGKFKGQGITFTLASEAELVAVTSTTGATAPELIAADGTVWAHKFTGTLKIVLPKGTYVIASGQKDKETTITSLKFNDTAASSAARLKDLEDAINAIVLPVTINSENAISAAELAYSALTATEKSQFATSHQDMLDKLTAARASLNECFVQDAIDKINAIGNVNKDSYPAILAAQTAYGKVPADLRKDVTNYDKLQAALAAWQNVAVQAVMDAITALPDVDGLEIDNRGAIKSAIESYEDVKDMYDALDDGSEEGTADQQSSVTNRDKLIDGLEHLEQLHLLFDFRDELAHFSTYDHTAPGNNTLLQCPYISKLFDLHSKLTPEQLAKLTTEETQLYTATETAYNDLASQRIESSFEGVNGAASNPIFKVSNSSSKTQSSGYTIKYGNKTFTKGLKIEKSTNVDFTLSVEMKLTLYVDGAVGKKIKIDGTDTDYLVKTDALGDTVVEVTLAKGAHKITKGDSMNLWYAILEPTGA